jgi:hypothetical protein
MRGSGDVAAFPNGLSKPLSASESAPIYGSFKFSDPEISSTAATFRLSAGSQFQGN